MSTHTPQTRIKAIDIVRGITIALVVMGHTEPPAGVNNILTSFRMPLFFMVSGYLLNVTKHTNNYATFIKGRIWRLLVPYFSACTLFYLLWLIRQNIGTHDSISWSDALLGIFYGNSEQLYINVPLWFLVSLFCSEIIFLTIMKTIKNYTLILQLILLFTIGLIGFLIGDTFHLPWGLDIALVIQPFLFIGNKLKAYGLFKRFSFPILFLLISLITFSFTSVTNGFIDISNRIYGNFILFYLNGFLGSFLMLQVAQWLEKTRFLSNMLIYFGKQSINILIFHSGAFLLLLFINNLFPSEFFSHWIIQTITGITVSLVVSIFVKKHPILRMFFNGVKIKNPISIFSIPKKEKNVQLK